MKQTSMLLLILLGLSLTIGCSKSGSDETDKVQVPVAVQTVTRGDVVQTLSFNGDIHAEYDVKVFSKIPDRIETFFVDVGDVVTKGQAIAKIAATAIEQASRQAEAGLAAAKAQAANMRVEYERSKRLYNEKALSQQQFDAIETQYEAATAQVEQAEAAYAAAKSQLNDATITSPINGIIGMRNYEAGDMAAPSLPVVSVVQMDRVKTIFDATEEDLGRLALGQKAQLTVRSYPDVVFEGKVVKISPILDPVTRMAEVEVIVPNHDKKLKPGMYASVTVTTGVLENVIVVPRYAVIENTSMVKKDGQDKVIKNYFVYIADDSSNAEQRKLSVDYVNHVNLAVSGGLTVGEKLVVSGQNNLRDGIGVLLTDEEETE